MKRQEPPAPPVVLLCGGLGLRQRTEGDDLPKPLRPLPDGRPLLLHVMDYYRAFGLCEFILCVGYGAEDIEKLLLNEFLVRPDAIDAGAGWHRFEAAGLRITLVDSGPRAAKNLRLLDAREHIGEGPFLLGYADVLSDFDLNALVERHTATDGLLTLVATRVRSRFGELVVDGGTTVTGFEEKPQRPALVSAGYFMCAPELFDALAPDTELETHVLPGLVAERAVHAVVHEGLWLPLDTYKDFIDVEELMKREGFPWLEPI
ncbi:sugar phosphate nucleotidyltransferase [Streptomyces sp. NPDC056987]|uniref:sugar phosphate nucleotidyltransferase n=1 Tax=Streptomyces sp. NPDC056987 TaxID=3345988 RepID=UPI003639137C